MHYFPIALPVLLLLFVLFITLLILIEVNVLEYAYQNKEIGWDSECLAKPGNYPRSVHTCPFFKLSLILCKSSILRKLCAKPVHVMEKILIRPYLNILGITVS